MVRTGGLVNSAVVNARATCSFEWLGGRADLNARSPHGLFLIAATGILVFDLLASLLSRLTGIPYAAFSIGSFLIYLAAGYSAQRRFGFGVAALVGAGTGLAESTVGWGISWLIGPGRSGMEQPAVTRIFGTVILVVIIGSVVAMVGAAVARIRANPVAGEARSPDR